MNIDKNISRSHEGWALKNWCFQTVVLEKTFENPLDSKEIKSVTPKGNQHLTFIGRMNAEAKTSILWPRDEKNWLIWIAPDAGWGRLKAGGEGDNIGWNGWVASLPQWTWVWVNSTSWWWIGKPGVLQSMVSQSQTRLSNWTELKNWNRDQRFLTLSACEDTVRRQLSARQEERSH